MKDELDRKLFHDFPLLYIDRHGDGKQTRMTDGLTCGDGWYELIYELSKNLEDIISRLPCTTCECNHEMSMHSCDECCTDVKLKPSKFSSGDSSHCLCVKFVPLLPRAVQVKEKFGMLRFYMSTSNKEIDELIQVAQKQSAKICSECGAPGKLTSITGWMTCLCKVCLSNVNK